MYLNFLLHFWSYNNSLKNTVWRSSQLIHAPARNKKSGPLFGRLIYFSLQCSCFFGSERNLLVMFFLPMFVMPWLPSLIWFCCWERLRRAAPLGLGRLGRTHKLEGVGTNSSVFIIQHGVMRAESHNAHPKENAYNTLGYWDSFIYIVILL